MKGGTFMQLDTSVYARATRWNTWPEMLEERQMQSLCRRRNKVGPFSNFIDCDERVTLSIPSMHKLLNRKH